MTQTRGPSESAVAFVVRSLEEGEADSRRDLERLKKRAAKLFFLDRYPSNSEILAGIPASARGSYEALLVVHPRRSASGIVVVTAFSAPFACPHGTCVFCPGGPSVGTPQSYLPDSPGMKTALSVGFDPCLQVKRSLTKYASNGHEVGKVEAIIEGGTFLAIPQDYQEGFVKGVYDGLNGVDSADLEDSQLINETSASRCVGLTMESKPDWCEPEHIDLLLRYGVTRLEIGVQSLHDSSLRVSNRGHTLEDSFNAFRVARDAGLKVTAHMMPGLPGADPSQDLEDLKRLFDDDRLRPDMTKIYPTLVVPGTSLERQQEAGLYQPYDLETVVELLSEMKRHVPPWHRIMRIQREIPSHEISGGVRNGNLRQLVLERVAEKGFHCNCIRCREVALRDPDSLEAEESLDYREIRYDASSGLEIFGSYEYVQSGLIAGFFRMRVPSDGAHRVEMESAAVVRELRVYGKAVAVGARHGKAWQHRGLGSALMANAERVGREEFGVTKLLVTSAIGTRNYYRRLGFERQGPYMAKGLGQSGDTVSSRFAIPDTPSTTRCG